MGEVRLSREALTRQAIAGTQVRRGDALSVYTRMGVPVLRGTVTVASPVGICLHEEQGGERFYASSLYLFVPYRALPKETNACSLDMPEDERQLAERRRQRLEIDEARGRPVATDRVGKPHPDNLPDDIRKAIVTTIDVTEEQLQRVLGAIGEAALQALKDIGIPTDEIYGRVATIQNAVRKVLQDAGEDAAAAEPTSEEEDD